ncbi:MAG TPA: tetratricopeptide repeat protein [Terriglobales bacterium]|nr:tetratricopeptide repeat protein [Terriglobales bacterium]
MILTLAAAAQMGSTLTVNVRGDREQAVSDVRVELRNRATGQIVANGMSGIDGNYDFRGVPSGSYEVLASRDLLSGAEPVQVAGIETSVTVHLSGVTAQQPAAVTGGQQTVSVSQLMAPKKARGLLEKAQDAMSNGKLTEAWDKVEKALAIYPNFAEALTVRAIIELDQSKTDAALADLQKAINADPGYPMQYLVMGAAFNMLSRFDEAIRTLERGTSLAPNSWQGYYELGRAHLGKAEYKEALKYLNQAEDMAPRDYAPVHLARANLFLAMKDYPEAMNELENYLKRDPQGPNSPAAREALQDIKAKAFVAPQAQR